jgi:hypothetical protein
MGVMERNRWFAQAPKDLKSSGQLTKAHETVWRWLRLVVSQTLNETTGV